MKAFAGALSLLTVGCFGGAHAATLVEIASYNQVGSGKTFAWDGSGANGGRLFTNKTLAANPTPAQFAAATAQWVNVLFNFNDAGFTGIKGQLLFNAVAPSGPASQLVAGAAVLQYNLTGDFQFRYTGAAPLTVYGTTVNTGANLLSGTFTNGWLSVAGTSGNFADSFDLTGGTVTLTSALIPADKLHDADLAFALSGIGPSAAIIGSNGTRQLRDFRASSSGLFSTAAVPEPATWAMLIVGFAGAGAVLRRRRGTLGAAA